MTSQGYLIDTNIVSELMKNKPNGSVTHWLSTHENLFLSTLTIGELLRGAQNLRERHGESVRAEALDAWIAKLEQGFSERILPVDQTVAHAWSKLPHHRTLPPIDSLIAATALAHHLAVVTRNVKDFADLQVTIINPFE